MASSTGWPRSAITAISSVLLLAIATTVAAVFFFANSRRVNLELQDTKTNHQTADRNHTTLMDHWDQTMQAVLGSQDADFDRFSAQLASLEGADTTSLVGLISQQQRAIADAETRAQAARDAQDRAQADLLALTRDMQRSEEDHAQAIAAKDDLLGAYRGDVEVNAKSVQETIDRNNQRVENHRFAADAREAALQNRVAEVEQELLVRQDIIRELRGERDLNTLRPTAEYGLVDARVLNTSPGEGLVFLNIGRQSRVILGMSFEIYSDASAIRPDAAGDYPDGKATVEIIRVNDNSSTGRIIREARGNPVVEGDVLANAVYDPNKRYTFVVFGLFDTNGDGAATVQEGRNIEALIGEWGGEVVDELSGFVDFLVLGERPVVTPDPSPDAPSPIVMQWANSKRATARYDELFRTATSTEIPVLNTNRLFTLTGLHAGR